MIQPLYQAIASALQAKESCRKAGKIEWYDRHQDNIDRLVNNLMPSGSGVDHGTVLDNDSTPDKLVFTFGYHHMNDNGMYTVWTYHKLVVKPSLVYGITLCISGRDRNGIKEYLYDLYHSALTQEIKE